MPPLLSLNLPDYDGPGASQDSAAADTHSQLQGPADPSDIQTNADLITSTNDMQNHSFGFSAFADSLHLSDQLSFQGPHLQFPHLSGKETTQDIYTTTELRILGGRNKYGPRSMRRQDNYQPGSVGMDAPIYPEFSFIPPNFPSQISTCAELTGISPGFGPGTFDAPAAISGPSQWHDPVPVPMPVSMTIAIPQPGIYTVGSCSLMTYYIADKDIVSSTIPYSKMYKIL
ncbi:hypothetical protein A7U60_g7995 [Sanghuangporus baumii]|uniref:Uncharacterized protein n=1 Tax=Sanghuangporus baumii TaxID=108892 RepID=A0A9Q5N5D1_SANBA|nr:hypothetical protein A7U60_g7995 [Sanghuangporus baumii]